MLVKRLTAPWEMILGEEKGSRLARRFVFALGMIGASTGGMLLICGSVMVVESLLPDG